MNTDLNNTSHHWETKVWDIPHSAITEECKNEVQKILSNTTTQKILTPVNVENELSPYVREFYKTFASIGINSDNFVSSCDLKNMSNDEYSYRNYEDNYKMWLWKKLFLTKSEIKSKSIEDIDNLASNFISLALQHIQHDYRKIPHKQQWLVESEYFSYIHDLAEKKTVWDYLKLLLDLEKRRKALLEEQKLKPESSINFEWALNEIKKAKFEIQRVLWLALLYIDREKTHAHQHTKEDTDFIIKKLEEIIKPTGINNNRIDGWKPLYHLTHDTTHYWHKNNQWEYVFSSHSHSGNEKIIFSWLTISGKYREFSKTKKEIPILHSCFRDQKGAYSSVTKLLRKKLTSFEEIPDNKWFLFVVNDFKEGEALLKIIGNELGTLQSSWIEEPEYMQKAWNEDTNSCYNSLKGRIKIPYKGLLIKSFFTLIDDLLKGITLNKESAQKLKALLSSLDEKEDIPDTILAEVEKIIETSQPNQDFRKTFNDLKSKFKNKEYNIIIEIQIFDIQNYMKAEIDTESLAHHDHYKDRQFAKSLPILFPPDIYWKEEVWQIVEKLLWKIPN